MFFGHIGSDRVGRVQQDVTGLAVAPLRLCGWLVVSRSSDEGVSVVRGAVEESSSGVCQVFRY